MLSKGEEIEEVCRPKSEVNTRHPCHYSVCYKSSIGVIALHAFNSCSTVADGESTWDFLLREEIGASDDKVVPRIDDDWSALNATCTRTAMNPRTRMPGLDALVCTQAHSAWNYGLNQIDPGHLFDDQV
jgi:hypothetical protein